SLNQSEHHSQTLPTTLYNPYPLGWYAPTGAVPRYPSSSVLWVGKVPCQLLHRCAPPDMSSSPQGYLFCTRPPRPAYSHSASVGPRSPAHSAYAAASCHETWTTGCFMRPESVLPGPSGRRQLAPSTLHHQGVCCTTAWTVRATRLLTSKRKTEDQPNRTASVT